MGAAARLARGDVPYGYELDEVTRSPAPERAVTAHFRPDSVDSVSYGNRIDQIEPERHPG
jgi:hypothetical protein